MATNTYVALDKVTLTTSIEGEITFSSIPSTYTDLVIVVSARNTASVTHTGLYLYANGNASGIYSWTFMQGDGTTATSSRGTSTLIFTGSVPGALATSGSFGTTIINIPNYSNTTTYKTVLSRANNFTTGPVGASVGLYPSTNAISSIALSTGGTGLLVAGSTFSLYGIKAADVGVKATGGTVYSDATYFYHVFGSTGTFTPTQSITADVLCVAGGGGAGLYAAGGGGGGGVITFTNQSLTATGYTCTVGSGGAKSPSDGTQSSDGTNSSFGALTVAVAGGGGGGRSASPSFAGHNGGSGGGGGGASGTAGGTSTQTGTGATNFYGNTGGQGVAYAGAGGGGAGAAAATAIVNGAASGGNGIYNSLINAMGAATGMGELSGSNYYFAGGGAGFAGSGISVAALGGGGGADRGTGNGTANTGGGGGSTNTAGATGNGGSGVVIVRYAK